MKKTITLLSAIIICLSVNSQNKFAKKSSLIKSSQNTVNTKLNSSAAVSALIYKPAKVKGYNWDSTNTVWNFSDSTLFSYNTLGNETKSLRVSNFSKTKDTTIYNTAGYKLKTIQFYLNSSNSWDTLSVTNLTYNNQNLVILETDNSYNNNTISFSSKNSYSYNSVGQQSLSVYQNLVSNVWVNIYKQNYFYATNGQLNKVSSFDWMSNAWQASDSILNITWQNWTGDLNTSSPLTYIFYIVGSNPTLDSITYDSNGNEIKSVQYENQSNAWVYNNRNVSSYIYDSNNNILQAISMNFISGNTSPTIANYGYKTIYSGYNSYNSTAIIRSIIDANPGISIYPNPSDGILFLKANEALKNASFKVIDVLGKEVLSSSLSNFSGEINLSNQANGIYYFILSNEGKLSVSKLVLSK